VSGFFPEGLAGTAATWLAAIVTVAVWAYLVGERRIFRLAQYLLAGLATGYLVLLAVRDVLLPRLVQPLLTEPLATPLLWVALVLVVIMAAARWLPRPVVGIPVAVLVAATAAFALGGAVVGTVLPQVAGAMVRPGSVASAVDGGIALAISLLVLVAFVHGVPRGRVLGVTAGAGRWVLLAGIGGWLGFLVVSRLALVVDRVDFLLFDWIGLAR
jgi:hypothetical protein